MKYRRLDDQRPVQSIARAGSPHGHLRGARGMILALPAGGRIVGNVLVDLDSRVYVVPSGTLRNIGGVGVGVSLVPLTPAMQTGLACLLCGHGRTEDTHFPIDKGMGGRSPEEDAKLPRIRLCVPCHRFSLHNADRTTLLALIERAPEYWKVVEAWDEARPIFEKWVDAWRYKVGLPGI